MQLYKPLAVKMGKSLTLIKFSCIRTTRVQVFEMRPIFITSRSRSRLGQKI